MENLTIKIEPKTEPTYWYRPETLAGKLERELFDKGFSGGFGDRKFREKYILPNEDMRSAGLDLPENERAWRTWIVRQISKDDLLKIHFFEQTKLIRFLAVCEIEKMLKIKDKKLDDLQIKYLLQFSKNHKPKLNRSFLGYKIPPYFLYDLEFDGMDYQQEWDKNLWLADGYGLPVSKSKNVKESLRGGQPRSDFKSAAAGE